MPVSEQCLIGRSPNHCQSRILASDLPEATRTNLIFLFPVQLMHFPLLVSSPFEADYSCSLQGYAKTAKTARSWTLIY